MLSGRMNIDTDEMSMGAVSPPIPIGISPSTLKVRRGGLDVAVVGEKESLSQQAMMSIFDGDERLNVHSADSFEAIFKMVNSDECHSGIVPIENSNTGPLTVVYDLIMKYPDIKVIGEHIVVENHCLCAKPGTKLEEVHTVVAHPWAGAQCRNFLRRFQKQQKVTHVLAPDTSAACRVAQQQENTATIQTRKMAEAMGLTVLSEGISNDENNKTRFVLISKEAIVLPRFEDISTMVAFALHNRANSIFKALACFGMRDINIRRVVTRPTSQAPGLLAEEATRLQWEYYLVVDISGCAEHNKSVAAALAALDEFTIAKRVCGVYRAAQDRVSIARERFNSVVEFMRASP